MGKLSRELIQPRGMVLDQPDLFVPPDSFTGGENITFRNSRVNRAGGFADIWQATNPFTFQPIHLLYAPFQGTGYWCLCDLTGIFVTTGTVHTDITPAAGVNAGDDNSWTSGELNGLAVFNNGEAIPVYWPGSPQQICLPLPDFPATSCYALRPYKFYLVAMNISGPGGLDDSLLLWSDAAAPGTIPQSWTPGTDSDAGDNVLGDTTGAIIDGHALRDDFIIYKQRSTYIMQFIGGAEIMGFRLLWPTLGALNRNCIAEHRGKHYVLGDGDLWVHDGQSIVSIADSRVKTTFFGSIDSRFFRSCYVALNKVENEVYFMAPTGGITEPRLAVIYDIDADAWGTREIPSCPHAASGTVAIGGTPPDPADWDTFGTFWQFANRKWNEATQILGTVTDGLLFAQPSGPRVLFLDADVTNRGLTVDSRLDWLSNDMGSPETTKILRFIWPRFVAPTGTEITIRAGGQIDANDGINFETVLYTVGVDRNAPFSVVGRLLSVQFESDIDVVWELTGWAMEYEEVGLF